MCANLLMCTPPRRCVFVWICIPAVAPRRCHLTAGDPIWSSLAWRPRCQSLSCKHCSVLSKHILPILISQASTLPPPPPPPDLLFSFFTSFLLHHGSFILHCKTICSLDFKSFLFSCLFAQTDIHHDLYLKALIRFTIGSVVHHP